MCLCLPGHEFSLPGCFGLDSALWNWFCWSCNVFCFVLFFLLNWLCIGFVVYDGFSGLPSIIGLYISSNSLIFTFLGLQQHSSSILHWWFSGWTLTWILGLHIYSVRFIIFLQTPAGIPQFCTSSLGLLVLSALRGFWLGVALIACSCVFRCFT